MPIPVFLDISTGELFVIFIAIFVVFGPKKVPEIARKIGRGMNELKKVTSDLTKEFKEGANSLKDDIDVLKPDMYGNIPYTPPKQLEETTPSQTSARPFSSNGYNENKSNLNSSDATDGIKPADPVTKATAESQKTEDKGLLF